MRDCVLMCFSLYATATRVTGMNPTRVKTFGFIKRGKFLLLSRMCGCSIVLTRSVGGVVNISSPRKGDRTDEILYVYIRKHGAPHETNFPAKRLDEITSKEQIYIVYAAHTLA